MNKDTYKTVCNSCYRQTWYETEQPCHCTIWHGDTAQPCPGTLKVIDRSELAPQFAHYHQTGQRIIVKTRHGETLRGYVGRTTGWKPVYLLMNNTRSMGSSNTLTADDQIIGTLNKYR